MFTIYSVLWKVMKLKLSVDPTGEAIVHKPWE
jgi:hypothetical protein